MKDKIQLKSNDAILNANIRFIDPIWSGSDRGGLESLLGQIVDRLVGPSRTKQPDRLGPRSSVRSIFGSILHFSVTDLDV